MGDGWLVVPRGHFHLDIKRKLRSVMVSDKNDESMSGSYKDTPINGSYSDSQCRTPTGSERSVRRRSGSSVSSGSYPGNDRGSGS